MTQKKSLSPKIQYQYNSLNILKTAKTTLSLASKTLNSLEKNLPENFLDVITLLLNCQRLIITTGVGKSGIIAQKMAATLTSTGSPAIYLDPLNAQHGDLGIVSKDDIILAYSYSGESSEILALFPTLNQRTTPIISLTGNTNSRIAQSATISLVTPIDREGCPLNLAPTTSTTVAMALSDAIATSLMVAKDYQAKDFALNHPAGSLGRRLTLLIKDLLYEKSASFHCNPETLFTDILCKITASGAGAICIIDKNQYILGIITDGDIRRTLGKQPTELLSKLSAQDIMTRNPVTIYSNSLALDALNLMEQRNSQIAVLPVIDQNNSFCGIIRLHDLIKAGL